MNPLTVFWGIAWDDGRPISADSPPFPAIASEFVGRAGFQNAPGVALAQITAPTTPEARFERLPLSFAGGHRLLAFDGRLDNRDEMIERLGLPAREAVLPDGAIVAAALERWGDETPRHLLGDFALAAWDDTARRLLLACDPTGGRALYYRVLPGRIAFATELSALLKFSTGPHRVDEASLLDTLLWRPNREGSTYFQDVHLLNPASRLVWSGGEPRIDRFWRPDWGRRIRFRREEDYVEAARELLDRGVAAQLRRLGPIVCQMSGGLDSTAVAATAARLRPEETVHTVTAVPEPGAALPSPHPRRMVDEWPNAEAVAKRHPNMVAHRCPAGPITADELDPSRLFQVQGYPLPMFSQFGWYTPMLEQVRNLGASVLLIGFAGNSTLSWRGDEFLPDLLRSGHLLEFGQQIAGLRRWNGGGPLLPMVQEAIVPLLSSPMRQLLRRGRGLLLPGSDRQTTPRPTAVHPDCMPPQEVTRDTDEKFRNPEIPGHGRQRWQWMFDTYLRARRASNATRRTFGIERRDPLAHLPLVEFCLAIPWNQYLRQGEPRSLARRVLSDRMPRAVLDERRTGRQCPEWFHRLSQRRDRMMAEVERLESCSLARHMLNLSWMREILTHWPPDADAAEKNFALIQNVLGGGLNVGQFILWAEGLKASP
ncbi:MAG: asparagine synthase-related protein [Alphaproteobacteria bacterium]